VALVLLRPRVGSGPPAGHLVGEVFVTTLALFLLAYALLVMAQRFRWRTWASSAGGSCRAIAQAGVDATRAGRALQDAIRPAMADRQRHLSRDADHAGWAVALHHPAQETFQGRPRYASYACTAGSGACCVLIPD
jgi:hypothetical protein